MRRLIFLIILLTLLVINCSKKSAPTNIDPNHSQDNSSLIDIQKLSDANRQFSLELFEQANLDEPNENIVISPLSLSIVLGIVYNAALGTTLEEVAQTARYDDFSLDELNITYKALIQELQTLEPGLQLLLANSLWILNGYPIYDAFIQRIQNYYDAEAYNTPFDQTTIDQINQWVEEHTNGMITDLLESISEYDVMFAINAIAFKGDWKYAFDEDNTELFSFRNYNGALSVIPFMSLPVETFQYYIEDSFIASRLPYSGDEITLYVFCPKDNAAFNAFINELTLENITQWLDSFDYLTDEQLGAHPSNIMIPKFSYEYSKKLNYILDNMGMILPFDALKANFGNMTSNSPYIDYILQKTYIELSEEGTSAAAATNVCWAEGSGFYFNVNHPFVFMIYDHRTESILFLGKIVEL
ncbi:MAG: serpin family protein [Candidatus Cloacimonetes bacterium]|nr:serpin family protein [Candidatus Cloacimonadota bacterium]